MGVYCLLDEILLIEKIDTKRFLNIIREAMKKFAFVYKLFKLLQIMNNVHLFILRTSCALHYCATATLNLLSVSLSSLIYHLVNMCIHGNILIRIKLVLVYIHFSQVHAYFPADLNLSLHLPILYLHYHNVRYIASSAVVYSGSLP